MFGLINIYSKSKNEVSRKLSNFYHHDFVFDEQTFPSFESFLQCLKFSDPDEQLAVASLCAKDAKEKRYAESFFYNPTDLYIKNQIILKVNKVQIFDKEGKLFLEDIV